MAKYKMEHFTREVFDNCVYQHMRVMEDIRSEISNGTSEIQLIPGSQPNVVIRGKLKSGRVWKEPRKRFSSIIKTKGLRLSLEKKRKLRAAIKDNQERSKEIIEQKKADKEAKKQRRVENLKKAEENRKKSEVVQVIKNTAKIKRMKKKQLRMIEKRDTVGHT